MKCARCGLDRDIRPQGDSENGICFDCAKQAELDAKIRKRYLINPKSRVIHDLNHLTERCNTDQIKRMRVVNTGFPANPTLRKCRHCFSAEYPAESVMEDW